VTAYPYRPYRPYRRRGRGESRGLVFAAVVLAGLLAASAATSRHGAVPWRAAGAGTASVRAVAYAEKRIGLPYCWGGTGAGCFDCSGLVMEAWRSAGVSIARTSQDQWATEPHIPASRVRPGDLVFFAGADGTMTSPGHVGIVTGPGRMIEAYATGWPIRYASYDRPDLVGFTDPRAGA